uniref:Uncharacterized protein n=1 Tax=Arundo donax TaxID=35708 RepID=A0A0A9F0F8_ARUDO
MYSSSSTSGASVPAPARKSFTLSTAGALFAQTSSSKPAAQAIARSGSIPDCIVVVSFCTSLDSYIRSDIPVATAGSLRPPDALMLCRLR